MECLGMKKYLTGAALAFITAAGIIGCSDTSSSDTAGIFIETNTGNKASARVYVPTALWDLSAGDTVSLEQAHHDTLGDTIYVYENDYRKVVDSASVAAELLLLDSVPEGIYDSVKVFGTDGESRAIAIEMEIGNKESYYLDSTGIRELVVEELSGTIGYSDFSYLSVKDFGIKAGDSLAFYGRTVWGVENDTLVIYNFEEVGTGWSLVMDSLNVATGYINLGLITYGNYDSLIVKSTDGSKRKHSLDFSIDEGKSYYIDSNGATPITVEFNPVFKGNAQFYFSVPLNHSAGDTLYIRRPERKLSKDTLFETNYTITIPIDSSDIAAGVIKVENVPEGTYIWGTTFTISETPIFVSGSETSTLDSVSIKLPDGFNDLATVDENFRDMPFNVFLPASIEKPCLLDESDNVVHLDISDWDYYGDKRLYWGKMPTVTFDTNGVINFKVLRNCQETSAPGITLGTYVNHFEDESYMSESAMEKLKDKDDFLGHTIWFDSTDSWYLVNDFNPFVDGRSMTASFWLNMDSTMQAPTGKSYTRILSAKKDSVGFIVQQRAATGSINLRIDAHKNGVGDYNKAFGSAFRIMDGTWHNYAFTIRGDSVFVYVDGNLLEAGSFDAGEGFADVYNPAIGYEPPNNIVGGIDELFFFDGTQSENWMRLFYALQVTAR